jgi:hypothetical protein
VFLIDADMQFEQHVGPEILPTGGFGITATEHPGYVGKTPAEFPYERNPDSTTCIPSPLGERYYCGGFVGGDRLSMRLLASQVAAMIDLDQEHGITPIWHDESALNKALLYTLPPRTVLPPSYCYPDHDDYYRTFWPDIYSRKIVAVDKTAAERSGR